MTSDASAERQAIAHTWLRAVYPTAYVPLSPAEMAVLLCGLVDEVAAAVRSGETVTGVGERLVRERFTGADSLRRTVEVLGCGLLDAAEFADLPDLAERVVAVLGSVSAGYANAMRLDVFEQQEEIKTALLTAKQRVERVLEVSEARFREVFDSSAFGIAITDLRGACVEANDALAQMVGGRREDLVGRRLIALFHPDDVEVLTAAYRAAGAGRLDRFREQRRLVRADGEPMWVHLAVSLLRDADGEPAYFVTMVEDVTELHLLQKNLDHQLLHDSLTGLSNRQHFVTRLEAMHAAAGGGITLYHLDLDAFAVVNNGIGHGAGDRLLQEVGRRLSAVVEAERACVARVAGDEFAIVVERSADTPRVPAMIDRINEALERPLPSGVALSAGVGVVDLPGPDWAAEELLRAANTTLRQAKARGKRQWLTYDRHEDARSRDRLDRAARMPGALAAGWIDVEYQPVVDLADEHVVGHISRLRWHDLGHEECAESAEANGLALPLGQWALREAAGIAASWSHGLLFVELSPMQSRDADLVGAVRRTLDTTGLDASALRILLDTRAMLDGSGDDNAQVLRDNGIVTGLTRFNGGQAELALLAELPVGALLVDPAVVRRLREVEESLLHRAMAMMTQVIRDSGVSVSVPGVVDADQVRWWTEVGASCAFGPYFGDPIPDYEL
ncbi:diguanylate cyclase [Actinosynnema sp. NPDC020468]|uniref:diguanylate cyclase domain-containing protein n=1 Tax=Actinosynnema sp. NPDC020468 TaxID=3154488 RepID=UPI0033CF0A8E